MRGGGGDSSSLTGFVPWEISRDDDNLRHRAHYVVPAKSTDAYHISPTGRCIERGQSPLQSVDVCVCVDVWCDLWPCDQYNRLLMKWTFRREHVV